MLFLLMVLAIFVGSLMPIQASLNAEVTRTLGHPYIGALLSFLTGTVALTIIVFAHRAPFAEFKKLTTLPPHLFLGGLMGALFVGSSLFLVPKMGATLTMASFVTGQLLMSVVLDHFGLLGLPVQPLNLTRLLGIFLLFSGLLLVVKKGA